MPAKSIYRKIFLNSMFFLIWAGILAIIFSIFDAERGIFDWYNLFKAAIVALVPILSGILLNKYYKRNAFKKIKL